ncbi:MAG: beta/gamma crystallin family protein [Proteobacteria bacterium]|nr:beta/gamma crystallin family protein [Pseudomonadota bacterium]
MNPLVRLSIFGATALAASSAMAGVTFFENENYAGRQITADRALQNFPSVGFNDRARSAVVEGDSWQVCMDVNFNGGCTVLAPGRYPSLGEWSGRISSTRPVGTPTAAAPADSAAGGAVTFFGNRNFGGRQFTINQPLPNLAGTRANDRAESAIVEGGPWEVCADAEFRGDCQVFAPGRYPTLGALDGKVSSARPYHDRRGERDAMRRRATATLYSEVNLTGRAFLLGREGDANLQGQFNDRASSLHVDSGYWIFCSDAGFRGECRTFGPGDYAQLPPELENRISSGRRISNEYPYGQGQYRR